MADVHFGGLLAVTAIAFLAPLLLGLVPNVRMPSVVVELVAGILVGPSVLGWVELDDAIRVLATIGLAFLLFLAGLEIDFDRLRGKRLELVCVAFAASFGIAVAIALGLSAIGQVDAPLLIAIILVATSLGVVVPVLKDGGQLSSDLGQLVIAAASIADFGAVILLSLFFSREATGVGAKLILLGGFALVVAAVILAVVRIERSGRISGVLLRLQDTTAQIRVRGALVLLVGFAALAERFGLEVILGAFMAGAALTLIDRDRKMTHPAFRTKIESAGFGIFVPVFFVASGLQFDAGALFESAPTLALVPVFLVALVIVRGLPALIYSGAIERREVVVAALLQATSLPFIVAASMIGIELGQLDEKTGAALIAAGLLSVLLFPALALTQLRRGQRSAPSGQSTTEPALGT